MLQDSAIQFLSQLNKTAKVKLSTEGIDRKVFCGRPSVLKFIKRIVDLQWIILGLVWFYKLFVSPILPKSCIYSPSCSTYMLQSIKMHGILTGSILGCKRIMRCHPFAIGCIDPIPDNFREVIRWVL
ncbi:MAG: membrane protein insertion efficiency factor YidD [Firmicutes bacterium]|nr:membrane protein insertion efficiency factor YidD [Bacillota bacterium]